MAHVQVRDKYVKVFYNPLSSHTGPANSFHPPIPSRHIAFTNNMRSSKCPDWLKAAWDSLKSQPVKSVDRQKFVDEVASVVNKNFEDNQYLTSTFKLSESATGVPSGSTASVWNVEGVTACLDAAEEAEGQRGRGPRARDMTDPVSERPSALKRRARRPLHEAARSAYASTLGDAQREEKKRLRRADVARRARAEAEGLGQGCLAATSGAQPGFPQGGGTKGEGTGNKGGGKKG